MLPKIFCQSCTMPIDNIADRGTEANGEKSADYCKYCFQDGAFINPGMSLENMEQLITQKMQEMHLPENLIRQSITMLPHLKRWHQEVV